MSLKDIQDINILVTLDKNYIPQLNVMLSSLIYSNPQCRFTVYLLHSSIEDEELLETEHILGRSGYLVPVKAKGIGLENVPVTSGYPKEIYYRIFAAKYLPKDLERVLYLDPDIIVNGSILDLYHLPMEDYYFAAASHIGDFMHKINELRLDMDEESPYVNSGVMLMNLERLRREQNYEDVFHFIEKQKSKLILPDQDIISSLYGTKIYEINSFRYNMKESMYQKHSMFEKDLNLQWVRENSVIIHYCGRNKPWKDNYFGQLNIFYNEAVDRMKTEKI